MEAPQLWDISPTISVGIPVWPGDTPFEAAPTWQIGNGCPVHVSRMTMSTHLGAHTDAPSHYDPEGTSIDQVGLAPTHGRALPEAGRAKACSGAHSSRLSAP